MKNVDLTHRILELLGKPDIAHQARRGSARATIGATRSTPRSSQSLGWRPRDAFEQGLAETVAWYRAERVVVAADQGAGPRVPRRTTRRSTATPELTLPRGWTSARHRRDRLRGQPLSNAARAREPRVARLGSSPAARDRPPADGASRSHWHAVDLLDRAAVRDARCDAARPSVDLSLRRAGGRAATRGARRRARCASTSSAPTTCSSRRAARPARAACSSPARRWSTARRPSALDRGRPIGPSNPYGVSKLAQEMLGGRRAAIAGRPRPAVQPRRPAPVARLRRRRASRGRSREIEAGPARAGAAVGNLDARRDITDVRDTVRAYRLLAEQRTAAPALQRLLRRRVSHRRPARHRCCRLARVPRPRRRSIRRGCGRATTPSCSATARGSRADTGWTPAIPIERDARRSARLLAPQRG